MTRVELTTNLPLQTDEYKQFESEFSELNAFYWAYIASLELAMKQANQFDRLSEFIPNEKWKSLDVTSVAFRELRPSAERLARYSLLVHAISSFERYLSAILTAYLSMNIKSNKPYGVKFRLDEIPADADGLQEFLRARVVQTEVRGIIDEKYSERTKRIDKLLKDYGSKRSPQVTMPDDKDIVAAHEVRHNIVHCTGIADQRAVNALIRVYPNIKVGDRLELEENVLWILLGAVRDGARAVDVALRVV